MKIAVIAPFQCLGGAEVYSANLASSLSQLRNDVTFFVPEVGEQWVHENYENLRVNSLKSGFVGNYLSSSVSFELINDLISEDYDIVHVQQLFTFYNIFSSVIGKLKGVPTVLTDHGGGERLLAAFPHICAQFPNAFAAVSNFSLQRLLRLAPDKKNCVAYGGVNTEIFNPEYEVDELKQALGLQGFRTILSVGRILPHKGIDVLIKAFRYLPKKHKTNSCRDHNNPLLLRLPEQVSRQSLPEPSNLQAIHNRA